MSKKAINRLQNVAIFCLGISTAILFVQIQLYNLGKNQSAIWDVIVASSSAENVNHLTTTTDLSAPVGVAISSSFTRTGNPHFSTQDEAFAALGSLLGEALGAMGETTPIEAYQFEQALDLACVYYEFYMPLPACVISQGLLGTSAIAEAGMMRRIILAQEEDGSTTLRWWDGTEQFFICTTAVSQMALRTLLETDLGNDVFFAFEGTYFSSGLGALDPLSLFVAGDVLYPQLALSVPLEETTALLLQLGFNPHTNYRYAESNGTELVVEDERSLRIYPTGVIDYRNDGTDSEVSISALNPDQPSYAEAALGVGQLLQGIVSTTAGDSALYLQCITQDQGVTQLHFDYQVGGIPVLRANGEYAATVVLHGCTITSLTLYLRQYTMTDTTSLLLPLAQAAAVAQSSHQLRLAYVDSGAESLPVSWVSVAD